MHVRTRLPKELPVVLLIDDDLVSREVTATLLTMSGYSVHTAENGAAALEMLAAAKFQPEVVSDGCADARPERNAVDCESSAPAAKRASTPSAAATRRLK